MSNWSSNYLEDKYIEGEKDASNRLKCIVNRLSLRIFAGQHRYVVPADCIGINRITFLGKKLEGITFNEAVKYFGPSFYKINQQDPAFSPFAFSPAFQVGLPGSGSLQPMGRPHYFIYDQIGMHTISFLPIPSMDVAQSIGNLYTGTQISISVIVEYIKLADPNTAHALPSYIKNLLCKYYTLWKAFSIEGKGQDLNAALMYKELYEMEIQEAKMLLGSQSEAHEHEYDPQSLQRNILVGPTLPWNYGERVRR